MKMSENLRRHLYAIEHNLDGCASNPVVIYASAMLIKEENLGDLPFQRQLEKAAQLEYLPALLDLAMLHLNGRYIGKKNDTYVPLQNDNEGIQLLERASKMRSEVALMILAVCYSRGIGCKKNLEQAAYYVRQLSTDTLRRVFMVDELKEQLEIIDHRVVSKITTTPLTHIYPEMSKEGKTG